MGVMTEGEAPQLGVVAARAVREIVKANRQAIVDLVGAAYVAHRDGRTTVPHSSFLTFPDRPQDRIISLTADLRDAAPVAGMKWISSWPGNVAVGLPRASAVIILNRRDNGFPFAIMEGSIVSATRTAASAVLATECCLNGANAGRHIAFIGAGQIARHIFDMFLARGWSFAGVSVFDLAMSRAEDFRLWAEGDAAVRVEPNLEAAIRGSDLIVFATTASRPYVGDPELFRHNPLVLHISLRDLSPDVILRANNVFDDVDHCLRAATSAHLAEQQCGDRSFVSGEIGNLIEGRLTLDPTKTTIFSPFGLGVLDVALARFVFDEARKRGDVLYVPSFFDEEVEK